MKKPVDIVMHDLGNIVYFIGNTETGQEWIRKNLMVERWQCNSSGVACDYRMAGDARDGAIADGMEVIVMGRSQ
jgi:hypothetical protein